MSRPIALGTLAVALSAGACTADGTGTLAVRVSGEEAVREGFAPPEVVDGWTVTFEQYLVAIGPIELATSGGERHVDDTVYVADLFAGDAVIAEYEGLLATRWDRFSFYLRPPETDDEVVAVGTVTDEDVQRMVDGDFNIAVQGQASKDDVTVDFSWGIDAASHNLDCTNGVDGTAGVVVTANGRTESEVTFHVEHLLFDALGSENARLRFEAIAAMADADGHVAWEALAQQSLTDLRDANGDALLDADGARVVYDPGSSDATDLQAFIEAAVRTQAHLGGDGLCTIGSAR